LNYKFRVTQLGDSDNTQAGMLVGHNNTRSFVNWQSDPDRISQVQGSNGDYSIITGTLFEDNWYEVNVSAEIYNSTHHNITMKIWNVSDSNLVAKNSILSTTNTTYQEDQIGIYTSWTATGLYEYDYVRLYAYDNETFLTVTAKDGNTDNAINTFNASLYYPNGTFYVADNTLSGSIIFNLSDQIEGNYTLFMYVDNYKDQNTTINYVGSSVNYEFVTYPAPTINLSFYNEISKEVIENVTYELIFSDYAITGNTTTGYKYFDLNSSGLLEIVYYSDDYYQRKYYINLSPETNANISLYLINESATNVAEISYLVTDQAGVNLEGAQISALRRYVENNVPVFEVVEMSESNINGEGAFYLQKQTPDYKFIVTYNGRTVLITGGDQLFSNNIILKATIGDSPTEVLYDFQSLVYSLEYNNFTYDLTWSDTNAVISNICLDVYRYLSTGKTLTNSSCSPATSGSIELGIGGTSGSYEAVVTATYDGQSYLLTNLHTKLDGIKEALGVEGVFWTAVFVVVAATIAIFSPFISIIFAVVALIVSSMLGIISVSQGALMFIGSIAGFIIYSFRRGGA
jgi:hypothetical protein